MSEHHNPKDSNSVQNTSQKNNIDHEQTDQTAVDAITASTDEQSTGVKNSLISGLAALFGIQSSKNRERDFKEGNPGDFIMVGVFLVICLLVGMFILVKVVLHNA